MAGFRKAKAEQAALKLGVYGPPGSGKTFTSLLLAEGLGRASSKRVAFVDTEHGTDFYCKDVPTRQVHPAAFDFDAIYTRSITEITTAIKSLNAAEYGVVIIDSVTHLWEAARAAYAGKTTSVGGIPMHAWGKIKKPYKDLINYLLSSPMHLILCGRQGIEYETDDETEELRAVGVKMKAEGETPYEPHVLIRMESIRPKKTNEVASICAYIEKDRTGVLSGRSFINPTFQTLAAPILGLLGGSQARIPTDDETSQIDSEKMAEQDRQRIEESARLLGQWSAKITLAHDDKELKSIGKFITPQLKAQMLPADVTLLRERYMERENSIKLRGDVPAAAETREEPNPPTTQPSFWDAYESALSALSSADDIAASREFHANQCESIDDKVRVSEIADKHFARLSRTGKRKTAAA